MHEKPVLTSSHLLELATATKLDAFESWDVELIYVHFYGQTIYQNNRLDV